MIHFSTPDLSNLNFHEYSQFRLKNSTRRHVHLRKLGNLYHIPRAKSCVGNQYHCVQTEYRPKSFRIYLKSRPGRRLTTLSAYFMGRLTIDTETEATTMLSLRSKGLRWLVAEACQSRHWQNYPSQYKYR